jgi:inhibitor of cysteine peptidase
MKRILGYLLWLTSFTAFASNVVEVNVDTHKPTFQIQLKANPTTGYKWTIDSFDRERFKLVKSEYKAPNNKLIGAGGKRIYSFKLLKGQTYPKHTKMVFRYLRPWEPDKGSNTDVLITFKQSSNVKKSDKPKV